MKERRQKFLIQKEKEDAILNFVSRQAQEAILDPNLPGSFKDDVVDAAVGTRLRIAERRSSYNARQEEIRPLKKSQTIYEAN